MKSLKQIIKQNFGRKFESSDGTVSDLGSLPKEPTASKKKGDKHVLKKTKYKKL